MLISFVSGILAEAVSCILWLPIDIIKERLQVQSEIGSYKYLNAFDAYKQIIKNEGIMGLYRAYGATILSFGPFIGTNLMLYEKFKQYLGSNNDSGFFKNFAVAFCTGTIASFLTNPLDIAKVRMQVQRAEMSVRGDNVIERGRFAYRNVFHGMYRLAKTEGIFALWKGCGARVLYMSAQGAINLSLLDKMRAKILKHSGVSTK